MKTKPKPKRPEYEYSKHPCPACEASYKPKGGRQFICTPCHDAFRREYMRQYAAWQHGKAKHKPVSAAKCTVKTLRAMVAAGNAK